MAHRVTQLIIGLHNFSSGYAILLPGYKFCRLQFEILGYTLVRTVRRGPAWSVICPLQSRVLFTPSLIPVKSF